MSDSQRIASNLKQAPFWQILDQGAGRFVRIGASIVLARILVPEDFGVYALSLSLLELARLSGNLGIGSSIVQTSENPETFAGSAFWVNLAASILMFISSCILGVIGARVFDSVILIYTTPVLGVTLITGGISHINQSLLTRNLEFRTLAKASVTKLAVESVVSTALALFGFGAWSFIIGYVLGDVAQSILIWIDTNWRPTLKPTFNYPKRHLKFGGNIFLFCLSTYLLEQLPSMIVGRISSAYILGLFAFAWRQSRWIGDIPKLIGKNMLFPAFSRLQENWAGFAKLYDRWLRFLLIWGAPIFIVQFVFAHDYVPFVFGEKWIPAITALQVLVILAYTEVTFYVPHSEALTARGKVNLNVYWRIFEALAVAGTLFIVAERGSAAIAIGLLAVRTGILPFYLYMTRSTLQISIKELIKKISPSLLLSSLGWIGASLLFDVYRPANLAISISLFTLCSIVWIVLGLKFVPETKDAIHQAVAIINSKLRRVPSRTAVNI